MQLQVIGFIFELAPIIKKYTYNKTEMNKFKLTLLGLCLTAMTFGQTDTNQKLIELGKSYKDFMFRNEPSKDDLKGLKTDVPEGLKTAIDYIVQTITTGNKLLTQKYLSRPDDQTLKQIFIIRAVNLNMREENQVDNNKLIDSLTAKEIPVYELLDNYYGMLYTAVGNKNQPFDFSKVDFRLKDYNLKDDTEKGILVFRCIDYCGRTIWGYMNVVKPANTQKAYDNIKKFPKFNGRAYYQYADFYFPDFEMNVVKNQGIQSYKSFYLDKYFETLLSHLICLNKEGGAEKEKNDLLLGSILKEKNLYKFTKYKSTLEEIFKEQKQE